MQSVKRINWLLVMLPIFIFILGQVTLLSTHPDLSESQLFFFFVSYIVFIILSFLDYKIFGYFWKFLYGAVLGMLLIVDMFGNEILGSTRWINLGFFSLQPSEFAKIVTVIVLAFLISSSQESLTRLGNLLRTVGLIAPLFILVFLQPDLGTSLVLLIVTAGMLWFAGLNKYIYIITFLVLGIFSAPVWRFLKDYQKKRILVFLNPTLDTLGAGYNVIQSMIAVGSGQLLGRGFGHGTQSHLQFLPVYWTDFIFAAYSEEWGFVGSIALIIFYMVLLSTLLYIAIKVEDTFGSLLTLGTFLIFFFQFFVNIGMNLGLMPVTGIPLALVSYGGSSILTSMILLGIVHSVWINRKI